MRRVLVLDDENFTLKVATAIFKSAGWYLDKASSGKEALALIDKGKESNLFYDIILTDIFMPEMGGVEFISILNERNIDTPIIAMTSKGDKDLILELMRAGVSDFLEKPFYKEIIPQLEKIINKYHERNERDRKKQEKEFELKLKQFEIEYKDIENSLQKAISSYKQILNIDNLDSEKIAFVFKPLSWLGGDYFAVKHSGDKTRIFIADIAGHDAGASYYAVLLKMIFDEYYYVPGERFLQMVNKRMLVGDNLERTVTAQIIDIDRKNNRISIINAGHPSPIYIRENKLEFITISGSNMLGIFADPVLLTKEFEVQKGDRILLYTDGLYDTALRDKSKGKIYLNNDNILNVVNVNNGNEKDGKKSLKSFVDGIYGDVNRISNYKQQDDIIIIAAEV